MLQGYPLQIGVGCGVELCLRTAHIAEYPVHILHHFHSLFHPYVGVQFAAELRGYVVFAVGKRTGAAIPVHDVTGGTLDAGGRLSHIDRTLPAAEIPALTIRRIWRLILFC